MDMGEPTIGAIIGSAFLYDFKECNNNKSFTKINKNNILSLPNILRAT